MELHGFSRDSTEFPRVARPRRSRSADAARTLAPMFRVTESPAPGLSVARDIEASVRAMREVRRRRGAGRAHIRPDGGEKWPKNDLIFARVYTGGSA